MLNLDDLATVLHAMLTGFPERALNVVAMTESLSEEQRRPLWAALTTDAPVPQQVAALGEAMQALGADRALVNECYRAAFYASDDWQRLAADPLFAFFSANKSGHILDKWPHYFPIYSRHLAPYVGRPISLLEIGVYRGGSMRMWTSFLGPDARLVGMDIDPTAAVAAGDRYEVVLGDQSDPAALRSVAESHGPFDVIIDDGGHTMAQQITSVEQLFTYALRDGGVYLVEDCHTSYWADFDGAKGRPGTFMEWCKQRIDDVNGYHSGEIDPVWTKQVEAIHVYDSVVVLDKRQRFAPFAEQQGGSDFVFRDRPHSVIASELVATRQEALKRLERASVETADLRARLDAREADPARAPEGDLAERVRTLTEQLRQARGELMATGPRIADLQAGLQQSTAELADARVKLDGAWELLRALRGSASWRATRPLRRIRSRWR